MLAVTVVQKNEVEKEDRERERERHGVLEVLGTQKGCQKRAPFLPSLVHISRNGIILVFLYK